jgi:DNA-directed RNA polymerase specialized sigma24 family protein
MDISKVNKKRYVLCKMSKEDSDDIIQDVFLKLVEKKPDIQFDSYYHVMMRNEMLLFIKKEWSVKRHESEYFQAMSLINDESLVSPFNNLLYKELKTDIKNQFESVHEVRSASRQSELLSYLMEDHNDHQSAEEIEKDLGFNSFETAKATLRHLRVKLSDVRKKLKNENND